MSCNQNQDNNIKVKVEGDEAKKENKIDEEPVTVDVAELSLHLNIVSPTNKLLSTHEYVRSDVVEGCHERYKN